MCSAYDTARKTGRGRRRDAAKERRGGPDEKTEGAASSPCAATAAIIQQTRTKCWYERGGKRDESRRKGGSAGAVEMRRALGGKKRPWLEEDRWRKLAGGQRVGAGGDKKRGEYVVIQYRGISAWNRGKEGRGSSVEPSVAERIPTASPPPVSGTSTATANLTRHHNTVAKLLLLLLLLLPALLPYVPACQQSNFQPPPLPPRRPFSSQCTFHL
ncbi:hypothetical protein KM043_009700 [Ampulex compressa]|nr:hypothetical protein KM043_009700 [Ampulex compressa]